MKHLFGIVLVAAAIGATSVYSTTQERPRLAGKPAAVSTWTSIIPDPDKFDWSAKGGKRSGYYYRGMLPKHQPFYDYIQEKREKDLPLSWAEEALVRYLITIRRWPDPPAPNPFWAAFMRYLRAQPTSELSVAEMLLLDQLAARGLVHGELPPDSNLTRIREYLNSSPFHIRTWLERVDRQSRLIENLNSGWGYDMPYGAAYDPAIVDVMRIEIRETLSQLNDPDTAEGREVKGMEKALAGGDAAWQSFIEQRIRQMTEDTSAEYLSYQQLEKALAEGGDRWRQYTETARNTDSAEFQTDAADARPADSSAQPEMSAPIEAAKPALLSKAETYSEKNQYAAAVLVFTKALDADPQSAEAYAGRAVAKAGLNDVEGATGDINRALALDQDCASAYRARSMIKRALADPKGALADATHAVELAPTNHRVFLTRGLAYEALKDYGAAIFDYSQAIDLNPDYVVSFLYRGLARLKMDEDQTAVRDFDRVIAGDANNSAAYAARGLAKEKLGEIENAIADYKEALRINPQADIAQQGLVRLRTRNDRN